MPPHAMTHKEYREMLESLGVVSPEVIKAATASQERLIGDAITVVTNDLKDRLAIIKSSKPEPKVSTMTTFPKPKDIRRNQIGIFKMTKIEELFDAEFPNIKAAKFFDDDSRRVALRIWVADEVRKAGWTSYRIDTSYGGLVLDYTIPAATEPSFAEAPKAEPEVPTAPKSRFTFKRVLAGVVATAAVVTTVVVVVNKLRG